MFTYVVAVAVEPVVEPAAAAAAAAVFVAAVIVVVAAVLLCGTSSVSYVVAVWWNEAEQTLQNWCSSGAVVGWEQATSAAVAVVWSVVGVDHVVVAAEDGVAVDVALSSFG